MLKRLAREKGGNFALTAALASAFIILGIGMSIDYSRAVTDRDHLQQALDAGLLAAMNKTTLAEQREVIENVLVANLADGGLIGSDFDFDANGYLVNGAGYYLKGLKIDQVTGQLIGTQPEVLRITKEQFPAKATTSIEYRANIPAYPKTNRADSTAPGSELLDGTSVSAGGAAPYDAVLGQNITNFLSSSIPGGSVTVYDELGRATSVELRWAKTANATPGDPAAVPPVPAVEDTWSLFVAQNTGAGTGQVAYVKATDNITFGPTGPRLRRQLHGLSLRLRNHLMADGARVLGSAAPFVPVLLPALTLGSRPAAMIARVTRTSLLEALRQDYIRTALAKGLAYTRVLLLHGLKNAFLPVLTVIEPAEASRADQR